jgi:hypothetical protein
MLKQCASCRLFIWITCNFLQMSMSLTTHCLECVM